MEAPIYKMILDPSEEGLGMKIMSLVSEPAIMTNWVKFNEGEIKLAVQDEEQRIVFGAALIPDLPIKRVVMGQTFYVAIDKENILSTAIKFQKDGVANRIDMQHSGTLLNDITIFESFVTNENRVTFAKGFEDLPMGTWFISAKINNDEVWQKIKAGEIKGFSIDALFSFEPSEMLDTSVIQATIKEILNNKN